MRVVFAAVVVSVVAGVVGCFGDDTVASLPDASVFDAGGDVVTLHDAGADSAVDASDASDATIGNDASDAGDAAAPVVTGVYVTSSANGSVYVFGVDAGNVVGQRAGSPFTTGAPEALSIVGNVAGTRLYVGVDGNDGGALAAFTLDSTGNVTGQQAGSPFSTNVVASPTRALLNPAGTRLYVVHQGAVGGSIAVFGVDTAGNLTGLRSGSPFSTGSGTYSASVNASGTRLYVVSQESQGVFVFALDANGDVTALRAGSPFLTGLSDAPLLSALHPSGTRLYVTDQGGHVIVYTLDAAGDVSGQQSGSPFGGATGSLGVAVNRAGTRLYVGEGSGNAMHVYPLDAVTGNVTGAAVDFAFGIVSYDLTLDLAQTRLYVIDANGSSIAAVTLDANGDPQSVQLPAFDAGLQPSAIYAR